MVHTCYTAGIWFMLQWIAHRCLYHSFTVRCFAGHRLLLLALFFFFLNVICESFCFRNLFPNIAVWQNRLHCQQFSDITHALSRFSSKHLLTDASCGAQSSLPVFSLRLSSLNWILAMLTSWCSLSSSILPDWESWHVLSHWTWMKSFV